MHRALCRGADLENAGHPLGRNDEPRGPVFGALLDLRDLWLVPPVHLGLGAADLLHERHPKAGARALLGPVRAAARHGGPGLLSARRADGLPRDRSQELLLLRLHWSHCSLPSLLVPPVFHKLLLLKPDDAPVLLDEDKHPKFVPELPNQLAQHAAVHGFLESVPPRQHRLQSVSVGLPLWRLRVAGQTADECVFAPQLSAGCEQSGLHGPVRNALQVLGRSVERLQQTDCAPSSSSDPDTANDLGGNRSKAAQEATGRPF